MEMENNEIIEKFEREQKELKLKVIKENCSSVDHTTYVGGLDISFRKQNNEEACCTFVVMRYKDIEVIYESTSMITINIPYCPGYLGFREVKFFQEKIMEMRELKPEIFPQIILIDGNGIFHFNRVGSASHLGVLSDVATIGIAKKLYQLPEEGIERNETHSKKLKELKNAGDYFEIKTNSGEVLGAALLCSSQSKNPVYVSVGHKCTLQTAIDIVQACSIYKIPEPIRQADLRSREFLRQRYHNDYI